jgi:hypothetical protein
MVPRMGSTSKSAAPEPEKRKIAFQKKFFVLRPVQRVFDFLVQGSGWVPGSYQAGKFSALSCGSFTLRRGWVAAPSAP